MKPRNNTIPIIECRISPPYPPIILNERGFMISLPFKIFRVKGRSMIPRIKPGQFVLIRKTKKIKENDLILFQHPFKGIKLVKRVDHIEQGMIYALGENKEESSDSREFGYIPKELVIGKVIWII